MFFIVRLQWEALKREANVFDLFCRRGAFCEQNSDNVLKFRGKMMNFLICYDCTDSFRNTSMISPITGGFIFYIKSLKLSLRKMSVLETSQLSTKIELAMLANQSSTIVVLSNKS